MESRRYSIGEVSTIVGVPAHVLRQWEARVPKLKPKRSRTGHRYYRDDDIRVIRRIKFLVRHEKMALDRVARRIDEETTGTGIPAGPEEAIDLINRIEDQVRAMLDQLDTV